MSQQGWHDGERFHDCSENPWGEIPWIGNLRSVPFSLSCEACNRPWAGVLGRVRLHLCARHLEALGYGVLVLGPYTTEGSAPEPQILPETTDQPPINKK